ncbi:hypothetical protein BC938DRAFT_476031 [Jimgerdemannia flammicorona]|uniref:Uncharacterized protein n=1 Tax=Jimgerdemannia flammicorona TaxID=994334 RepID=A0A433PL19_9FUNG|nr:hypothetical protein BC938DRAFT_476031 [Jimgerdemannia flammicorona]
MLLAVRTLSPVTMRTKTLAFWHCSTASLTPSRSGSSIPTMPKRISPSSAIRSSYATSTVSPSPGAAAIGRPLRCGGQVSKSRQHMAMVRSERPAYDWMILSMRFWISGVILRVLTRASLPSTAVRGDLVVRADHTATALHKQLGGALDVCSVDVRDALAIVTIHGHPDHGCHSLALGAEGVELFNGPAVAEGVVILGVEFARKAEKGSLCLRADKSRSALVVLALEGSRVYGDGLVNEVEYGFRHACFEVLKSDEISAGGWRVLEEAEGCTKCARNDGHLVLGEGASFVGADGGGVAHGLTGGEDADEIVILKHALGGVCKG